jgi:hypothetical protein
MHLHLIPLDFLRRWWWLVAIFVVVTLVSTMARAPLIISPLAYVALSNDFQAGLLRTVRTLPVSRRGQAMTIWFIAVWLLPLIALFILPWGLALEMSESNLKGFGTLGNQPWFSAAAAWWLQLGSGALLYLLLLTAQVGMSSVAWKKKFIEAILGLAVVASIFGCIWIMGLLPRRMDEMHAPLWIWMGLVPIVVLLSALASWHWAKRPIEGTGKAHRPSRPREEGKTKQGSLMGMPLLVVETQLRSLGIYLLMVLFVWISVFLTSKGNAMKQMLQTDGQSWMFIMMLNSFIIPNALNLRMLRMLPLSTSRLALLLLSMPVSIGVANAAIAAALGVFDNELLPLILQCAARSVGVAGLGGLMLGLGLHLSSNSALIAMAIVTMVAMVVFIIIPPLPPLAFVLLGMAAVAGAFLLIRRVLDRSSKAYRPRRPMGVST